MAVATLDQLKAQVGLTDDVGSLDDALLAQKLAAAENYVERFLGFTFEGAAEADPPREGFEDGVPPALVQAVLMLAAYWYEAHYAASDVSLREVPFGVQEIVREFRSWTF